MIRHQDLSSSTQKRINIGLAYRSTEQGATLIVVLLFLVLIMLAGAIAVRQSTTDLKVATSDQINTVLLQSADSANQKLETMVNGSPASEGYKDVTSATGALGHFILFEENKVNEFIYCFNPRTQRYLTKVATVRAPGGGYVDGLNNGVCNYANASDYTSARQAVMTQMSIALTPPSNDATPFEHVVIGKEIEDRTSKKYQFDIRASSALPAYNEPKVGADKCFEQTSISANVVSGKQSLNECLLAASTPSKMLYEQADVANLSSSTECIPFGRGGQAGCVLASSP
ncbi:type IV fimbrial biogenesis protein PilX [Psychrobacter sp. JCM 18903]|uniref:PilX N-terminal domain-containing pilus assembly protein n=1 Tax=Psychrobacter sp. JCM 18903 TaxID=1298610 RepID=UPI000433F19F|nr:PilX N-terminal domain-containing pilus assembly protein [Psychrobacter sp. JCM 18903]GAF61053.1 type IV fimbrial biogenesis protein PilX [Psychrobacter sp. JCM 18903]